MQSPYIFNLTRNLRKQRVSNTMSNHPFETAPACAESFADARRPTSTEAMDEQALKNETALIARGTTRAAEHGITHVDIPLAACVYNMIG
jgi:HD superfamily phosphodiesterase